MKRTFNYTGRKRIRREGISITLTRQNGRVVSFVVDRLDLDGLELPSDAKVYVEAYYRTELKRFDFGTVGDRVSPSTDLTDMAYPENLKFRILVVNPLDGKLLAHADRIAPEEPAERRSILPVEFKDLDNEIWRVEYEGDEGAPILCINNKIPNIQNIAKQDPQFLIYVYPAVVREILTHMVFIEGFDQSVDWHRDWIRFSSSLNVQCPKSLDPQDNNLDKKIAHEIAKEWVDWVDKVVSAFSNQYGSKYWEYLKKPEETT